MYDCTAKHRHGWIPTRVKNQRREGKANMYLMAFVIGAVLCGYHMAQVPEPQELHRQLVESRIPEATEKWRQESNGKAKFNAVQALKEVQP